MKKGITQIKKKKYIKPSVEKIRIDRDISFLMASAGDPPPLPDKRYNDDDQDNDKDPFSSPFR